jgi:hypothetical protein
VLHADHDAVRQADQTLILVGAGNLCHQAIFVDDATRAVMPPDPEMIQVGVSRLSGLRPGYRHVPRPAPPHLTFV